MKTLYTETIETATISLLEYGDDYIGRLVDPAHNIDTERTYRVTPYQTKEEAYQKAITEFDKTCEAAAKMYNVTRKLPEMPNFIQAVLL